MVKKKEYALVNIQKKARSKFSIPDLIEKVYALFLMTLISVESITLYWNLVLAVTLTDNKN